MLQGDFHGAVRYPTERDQGGVFFLNDTDEKSNNAVLETLSSKHHPDVKTPEASTLHPYSEVPDFNDINVTEDMVELVARCLYAGPSGTHSILLQHWLLRNGESSHQLCIVVVLTGYQMNFHEEAKEACGIDQLCVGLEASIEGGIHAINHLWKENEEENDWGFVLFDAWNAFNKMNQIAMM
jgi:hypothetical protein